MVKPDVEKDVAEAAGHAEIGFQSQVMLTEIAFCLGVIAHAEHSNDRIQAFTESMI